MYPVDDPHHRLSLQSATESPPHWAVVVVKICAIGILLLPILTMVWLFAYRPSGGTDYRALAFPVCMGLGFGMWVTATFLTTTYPPVRPHEKR